MNNPFELTFGLKPSNYISRLKQSDEIISNFKSKTGNKSFLITGVRGTGKTVMLSHISKQFENEKNWIVIELIPNYDMLEQFASALYDSSIMNKIFNNKTFGFSFSGISFSIIGEKPITNVISLIEVLLDRIKKCDKSVLIAVDEVSNNDYVKTFTQAFQLLIRKEYPIHLLMTGLYQNIYELQNDKDLTFLYRAPKISLEPLNLAAITNSYQELLNITKEEALLLAKETKGYAYAYQVLGYLMWEEEEKKISKKLLSQFDQYLSEFVYDKIWEGLSEKEINIIIKISRNETLDMKPNEISVYRDRLIKYGVLESRQRGKLSFALPRFKEYIDNKLLFE